MIQDVPTGADALLDAIARIHACADDILCALKKRPNSAIWKRWFIGSLSDFNPNKNQVSIFFAGNHDTDDENPCWRISLVRDSAGWELLRILEGTVDKYGPEPVLVFPKFETQTIEELLHSLPPLLEEFIAKTEQYSRD